MTIYPEDHIKTLQRRRDFLKTKIEKKIGSDKSMNCDRREMAALNFAINVLVDWLGYSPGNESEKG